MRFRFEQRIAGPVDDVARTFADPGFYATLGDLPKLGSPQVLDHRADGDTVTLHVRYRFTGELSAAARAVLDPERLTWIEESVHDLAARHATFRLLPDHYADRFRSSGEYRFVADGNHTQRASTGEVVVRTPLIGPVVERAIVSGLREHLDDEVDLVESWLRSRSDGTG